MFSPNEYSAHEIEVMNAEFDRRMAREYIRITDPEYSYVYNNIRRDIEIMFQLQRIMHKPKESKSCLV